MLSIGAVLDAQLDIYIQRWLPSPLVRGAVANPVQMLLDRRQGLLEGGKRPERDLVHDVGRALVRLDDEPRPARSNDAPHRTAQQVRQGPSSPVTGRTRYGDVHARLLPRTRAAWRSGDRGLLFVIFVTLANATGDPLARFIGPTNDRDAAATLLADDLLLRASARVNLHPTRADLNGGLSKGCCAGQQPQRDQDGILHQIFLQAPARWVIDAQHAEASRVQALFKAGIGPEEGATH